MNNPIVSQLIMLAVPILIIYFIILRPQQVQKRKHEESLMAIKKGDEIITAGGIVGDVLHIKSYGTEGRVSLDDRLTIRSGESKLVVERGRVARVVQSSAVQSASTKASVSSSAN
jgi:preprotein translocase subunit YajC